MAPSCRSRGSTPASVCEVTARTSNSWASVRTASAVAYVSARSASSEPSSGTRILFNMTQLRSFPDVDLAPLPRRNEQGLVEGRLAFGRNTIANSREQQVAGVHRNIRLAGVHLAESGGEQELAQQVAVTTRVQPGSLQIPVPVRPHGQQDQVLNPGRLHAEVKQPARDPQLAPVAARLDAQLIDAGQVSPPIDASGQHQVADDGS